MRRTSLVGLLLLALTLAVYSRAANLSFISFDDPGYVTSNGVVREGLTHNSVPWAFASTSMSNWHPVTWLSHMADVQMFGLEPAGHHLVSVVLHALSSLLLFLFLRRATGSEWRSLVVAALFALHPMHVESVAWVSERKDVLSGLFWNLGLLLYVSYASRPSVSRYLAVLASFAVGLMAKPMVVTFPVVLLLLDHWPLGRTRGRDGGESRPEPNIRTLLVEKVPFLIVAALSAVATVVVQHRGGAVQALEKVSFGLRGANAFVAYVRYVLGMVWPHDMAILYPFPTEILAWQLAGSVLFLAAGAAGALWFGRRVPYLVTGWFWFVVTLLPVIGLIQVGGQSHADRYTYLPFTGLFIIVVWGAADVARFLPGSRAILPVLGSAVIATCAAMTRHQLEFWRDDLTLYRHTLDVTRRNYLILNNYGIALAQEAGDLDGAILAHEEAVRVWPGSAFSRNNLGAVYLSKGRYRDALEQFQEAVRLDPAEPRAQVNVARVLARTGRSPEATQLLDQVLRTHPESSDAHLHLAVLLIRAGRIDDATPHVEAALRLDPTSDKTPLIVAVELATVGRSDEARHYFERALAVAPESVDANFNMGVFLAKHGRPDEAAPYFHRVLKIRPNSEMARQWLAKIGR